MDWKGGGIFGIERRPILRSFDGKGVKGKRGPAIFFLAESKRRRLDAEELDASGIVFLWACGGSLKQKLLRVGKATPRRWEVKGKNNIKFGACTIKVEIQVI